jgi:hypothetical protein
VYFPSLMLMALHEERVLGVERRAVHPAWRWLGRGRARRRLALSARARADAGQAGLLAAGARS